MPPMKARRPAYPSTAASTSFGPRETTVQQADPAKKAMAPEDRQRAFVRIDEELMQKYGVVEVPGFEVTDYHTQILEVPPAFFKKLNELEKSTPRQAQAGGGAPG